MEFNIEGLGFGGGVLRFFRASEGWCLLGYAYLDSGDLLSAARAFSAAASAAPAAAAAHLGAGQTQALLHNWPVAERLYAKAANCRCA